VRVSAERVFELARHLTERDREIGWMLFEQQVLTTDQLTLLFFSSKRRAQDRLLFLYRDRVLDRFYPPAPFGSGKPQAHWLLDEAGAILVAAQLGVERKKLGWQRRDDWGSHPQLAHRLETNRFVTDLIAATLADGSLGVTWWVGSREAGRRLSVDEHLPSPRPDGAFELVCSGGSTQSDSRRAPPHSKRASPTCTSKTSPSPPSSPHKRPHGPTPPASPPSPTNSKR
jgi:Replication-relaxation